ncbi:MAG TPA: UvrD-helicase domain-containing protein [Mycobacteriales bacterium]
MTAKVVLSDLFQSSYDSLDGSFKARVMDFLMKLQRDPDSPGLDLKLPKGAADRRVRTARVNDDYRAVLLELPDRAGYVLAAVKSHDEAYRFAERVVFGVNEVTGALELLDPAALRAAITDAVPGAGTPETRPVLSHVRERELRRLGFDEQVAGSLVRITDEDALLTVADRLPRAQAEALLDLAAGRTVDEVWVDLVEHSEMATGPIDTTDVLAALERPLSRLSFTSPDNEAELRAVLEGSFEKWRVWLHPLQRRVAYRTGYRGPVRVTGGAGTGKTVTALHRAAYLAAGLSLDQRVLFTTYTRTLAQLIKEQLVRLAGPSVLSRVDVLTVDALARRVLAAADTSRDANRRMRVASDTAAEVTALWEQAARGSRGGWTADFLASEWSSVILAQGIRDRDAYLIARRAGRGRRLSRIDRADLWQVFERFTLLLAANETMTFTQIAARAADAPVGNLRYRYAVVDEAQDLHPAHWRLLRRIVPEDTDDLFLVGDAHQRIYAYKVSLSSLGIETRGRSRRLTVNYRTSREILRWCLGVVDGHPVDDLDTETDTLAGARSAFRGPDPVSAGFDSRREELAALTRTVHGWIGEQIVPADICVMTRTRGLGSEVAQALADGGLEVLVLGPDTSDDPGRPGVRVATMHRAKGLEFRAVALVGVEEGTIPVPPPVTGEGGDHDHQHEQQERCLLYVAGSRARERLSVTWTGKPSPLLP